MNIIQGCDHQQENFDADMLKCISSSINHTSVYVFPKQMLNITDDLRRKTNAESSERYVLHSNILQCVTSKLSDETLQESKNVF